jgi:hypothetical protein
MMHHEIRGIEPAAQPIAAASEQAARDIRIAGAI